ncbi:MAG: anion permease [Candidatus Nanohalobium sp.]
MILTALALIAAVFMGISIGASSVAPAFGPVNSSGSINVLRSALIAGIFAFIGAVTQGGKVANTVGSGILTGPISMEQGAVILLVAAGLVIVSVLTDYPMPTAFTVIGAVIGSSFAFGNSVVWGLIHEIIGFWLLVPFVAVLLGYVFARLLRKFIPDEAKDKVRKLLMVTGGYLAYSAGASAVGLAVGPLSAIQTPVILLLVFGGLSILVGAWMYSPRIIKAISYDYSSIGPRRSVAALATAGIMAQIGVLFGIPISFNEAVIASVIGSGLVEGKENADLKKISFTAAAWIGAFLLAGLLTYVAGILIF